ncbi:hypothetical protein FRC17_004782 [Serendipita sp. 399]|nr:hypothetical protein FRC17_004782 [Serendipita sp. 399]
MSLKRVPLSLLPLPPVSRQLTHNLTPDPIAKSPGQFLQLLHEAPSLQRRARLLDPAAHFSYVTPLPLPFPFRIDMPEDVQDKKGFIEAWLGRKEATDLVDVQKAPQSTEKEDAGIRLRKFTSEERIQDRRLLGISPACIEDCFPTLDVGDGFNVIGSPSLTAKATSGDDKQPKEDQQEEANIKTSAGQELLDILSGNTVLGSYPENDPDAGYAPWSLRYSGHQFGQWAGQLGDGRAISILEVANDNSPTGVYELQLKGAGRTPFSRSADGLAVVRSSIREYLCAEAMHALGIPTTRSLALTHLPTLPVVRERIEKAAIVTRVAPSFLRIGSFQALNPPEQMFFLGGGQQAADLDALRNLGEYTSKHVLKLGIEEGKPWAKALIMECARRNALMVAGWQAYGFMHGVMNTDNISIMGLTIDYGPYAFMDVYDPAHICNHSDDTGRYSFKLQPTMVIYAHRALLSALAPVIGAENATGAAVATGWNSGASEDDLSTWTKDGLSIQPEVESFIMTVFKKEYDNLMRKRLGLRVEQESDYKEIIAPLLEILERRELDHSSTFRTLSRFTPQLMGEAYASQFEFFLLSLDATSQCAKVGESTEAPAELWRRWLQKFANRIEEEREEWSNSDADWLDAREKYMLSVNPRFILRQWVLEEVIKKVEADAVSGRKVLAKVLQMASNPFDLWGAEDHDASEEISDEEIREERRLCGLGDQTMLGFQCSCSS